MLDYIIGDEMKPYDKQEAMLHWLRQHKKEAQYKALVEMEHHGSSVYIAKENEEAKMIEEIIQIIESAL